MSCPHPTVWIEEAGDRLFSRCVACREVLRAQDRLKITAQRELATVEYLHHEPAAVPADERTVRVGLLHGVVVGAIFCAAMAAGYRCGFDRGATYSDDGTVHYFSAEQSERFDALRRVGWTTAQALAEVSP